GNATKAKTTTTTGPQLLLGRLSFGLSFASSCSLSLFFVLVACLDNGKPTRNQQQRALSTDCFLSFCSFFKLLFELLLVFRDYYFLFFFVFFLFLLETKNNFFFFLFFFCF